MDSQRAQLERRLKALKQERDSKWLPQWRDLSAYIEPDKGKFSGEQANDGQRKDQEIINNTAREALGVLASGMFSGMTSPSRPWFKLATPDTDLMEFGPVKLWLDQVENVMRGVFARSNLYNILPMVYGDTGLFGVGAMAMVSDSQEFMRAYTYPCGTYMAATSDRQQVDTLYREFRMTARQMAQQFGKDALSSAARNMLDNSPDAWVDVCHAVESNDSYQAGKIGPAGMAYRSIYWEKNGDNDKLLRVSGFREMPFMVPRWHVNGENVYGNGPGSRALGDVRALQLMERRKAELIEKGVRPPMGAPVTLKGQRASILPGDVTYLTPDAMGQRFEPLYTVDAGWLGGLRSEIAEAEARINASFSVDLFLMISQMDDVRTATEIAARKEEKMLMLGPVLERMSDELLDPMIDRTFSMLLEQSQPRWDGLLPGRPMLPPPPEELAGMELKVEYISILAQAQKTLGVASIERTLGFVGNAAGIAQDVVDKIDFDQAVDEYAAMLGVSPSIIRSDDMVAEIRQQRAAAMQQEQAMQQAAAGIQGAKLLSETDLSRDSALAALTNG